jgi:hypothetical protein
MFTTSGKNKDIDLWAMHQDEFPVHATLNSPRKRRRPREGGGLPCLPAGGSPGAARGVGLRQYLNLLFGQTEAKPS